MDLNEDLKLPTKPRTREKSAPDDARLLVGTTAGEVIKAHGGTQILSHLIRTQTESLSAISSPDATTQPDAPQTELERFLLSTHPSYLLKRASLEDYLDRSKQSIRIIDETDLSGTHLYDFVPPEIQKEIETQLAAMQNLKTVKETLESEISGFCGGIWSDHKTIKHGKEKEEIEHIQILLLGPSASPEEKKALNSVKRDLTHTSELAEMICLEKCRITTNALLAPTKTQKEREMEAESLLGMEFDLIKAQVSHLERCLNTDWIKCDPQTGIINPTSGPDLICPEIRQRMLNGEPSQPQLDALDHVYSEIARRKTTSERTDREEQNEKISFVLGSMSLLEHGKKAKYTNLLTEIREISLEKPAEEKTEEEPAPKNWFDRLRNTMKGKLLNAPKPLRDGVGKIIQQWPQLLGMHILSQAKDTDGRHFGCHEEWVSWLQNSGAMEVDRVM